MKYNYNNENNSEPVFNQAMMFVESLNLLEQRIDELLANKQLKLAYDLLRRVFIRIRYLAEKKEKDEEIKKLVGKIVEEIKKFNQGITNLKLNYNQKEIDFFYIDEMVWELQHRLHLIMPKSDYKPWDKQLEEDFQ
ncbi:MAG: hypothetical protein R6U15_00985 [Candidatus Izemoplasmatales bacterium]